MHSESAQSKPVKQRNKSLHKLSEHGSIVLFKKNILEAKMRSSGFRKSVTVKKDANVINLFFDIAQFALVPASVNNKSLDTKPVTRHALLKY